MVPIGRTFLSTNPAASAQFLLEYYNAELVELAACTGANRAAVAMPHVYDDDRGSPLLIVFIEDWTMPAGEVDVEAIVGGVNFTLEEASSGLGNLWFQLDNHDGWYNGFVVNSVTRMIVDGVPVIGVWHDKGGGFEGHADALVQIPHTFQTIMMHLDTVPEGLRLVCQDDCRDVDKLEHYQNSWWKSTFSAANPAAALDFAVNVLGASRKECPYRLDASHKCTSAAWVELPGSNFQVHFVRASGDQRYPGEMDSFNQQVQKLRNMTAGAFDRFMYNSLMLRVSTLDPWIERLQTLGLPFLVMQASRAEYALFLNIPENDITIQLRSNHSSASMSFFPETCTQSFGAQTHTRVAAPADFFVSTANATTQPVLVQHSGGHTSQADDHGMREDDRDPPAIAGAPDPEISDCSKLGPLRHLLGEWKGLNGITMNWLPPAGTHEPRDEAFGLYAEYNETLTFEPLARPAHNRVRWGGGEQQLLYGLQARQLAEGPHGNPLHVEVGQLLYDPAPPSNTSWTLARTGSLPHGASFVAVGGGAIQDYADILIEQEKINGLTNLDFDLDWLANETSRLHYAVKNYSFSAGNASVPKAPAWASLASRGLFGDVLRHSLIDRLSAVSEGSASHRAWRFQTYAPRMSETPDPFHTRVGLESFQSTFWLFENLTTPVLQYFQNVNFRFGPNTSSSCMSGSGALDCRKAWPHFQLATLVKVRDYNVNGC